MTYDLMIADHCFRFQNFNQNSIFSTFGWKLDPWKISSPNYKVAHREVINISCEELSTKFLEPTTLLSSEKTGFFERRVYLMSDGNMLWDFVRKRKEQLLLRFQVNSKWNRVSLLEDATNTQRNAAFEYLAQIMPSICLKHNLLTLHASLVELDGQAIAICAPSGTGKTTHARLWRDCKNALILNGDRAVCKNTEQGWRAYGTPWSGTSGEQINRSASLKAIVVLERGEENVVRRLSGIETFSGIFPHVLYSSWDRDLTECAMTQLDNLLCTIPVYHLCCRPDKDAVEVLYRAVWGK
ncbi:MAG: hypothetical protein ACI4D9_08770 [Lachnospiraceae bacterium]